MKLLSTNGVLPGTDSATGATGTYNPSSQSCPNGCGLDGSGCGPQGNEEYVNSCSTSLTGGELNGEEACENNGYTQSQCLNVGDGSCCNWNLNECWSSIGQSPCPGTGSPTAPTPTAPTPTAPTPTGGGGLLNGEEACEDNGYTQSQCLNVGDGSCCQWDTGSCWSAIGQQLCPGTGSPTAPTTTPPSPTGNSCADSQFRFKVRINGRFKAKDCGWVSNSPGRCSLSGVSTHCPSTCGTCSICSDGSLKFKLTLHNGQSRFKVCSYVAKKPENRCNWDGVEDTCRRTCGTC
jgi:hypothetical protein